MAGTVSATRCLVVLPDFRGAGQGILRIPSVRPAKKVVQNCHNAPHTCIHSAYTVVELVSPAVGRDGTVPAVRAYGIMGRMLQKVLRDQAMV